MSLEDQLAGWTGPSSDTEQDKQERTERMIRDAIAEHAAFKNFKPSVYAKGSYANNTNVRADSDVDIAVECTEAVYWEESQQGIYSPSALYDGVWTPQKLREELVMALTGKFERGVDASGDIAIRVHSSSSRVDADVVPCFTYKYYFESGRARTGTKIFKKDGQEIVNYPAQQLENGRAKNVRTGLAFKKTVRIMKRIENALSANGAQELPSYFIECLVYNCPDTIFAQSTWAQIVRAALLHMWRHLQGDEPQEEAERWREVNGCRFLFHKKQPWNRAMGRVFVQGAWNYLGLE